MRIIHNSFSLSQRGRFSIPLVIVLISFGLSPLFFKNEAYIAHLAIEVLIYASLATSLNLVLGYVGQFSFAHGAFFGIGAYTSSLLALRFGWCFWISMTLAILLSALVGVGLGFTTLRLRGIYLAICTMGFQLIFETLMLRWSSLTNGAMGLTKIPSPVLFGLSLDNPIHYFYLVFLWYLLHIGLLLRVEGSQIGFQMLAIREDEVAASASGINIFMVKIWGFVLSTGLAGGTGALYAHYIHSIDPSPFQLGISTGFLIMVIIGGRGTIIGGTLGALLLILLPEWLRFLQNYRMIIYGLVTIFIVLFMPNGLLGWINSLHFKTNKVNK